MREFSLRSKSLTQAALVFALLFAAVAVSYFFIDRALAELIRPSLLGARPLFIDLTYIVIPFTPAALLIAAFVALKSFVRGSLSPCEAKLLRLACAILVAGAITYQLKIAFGRTWPETWVNNNPSYFGNGTYGFFPFRGGQGYASFPSGHTTAAASLAGALWVLWPAVRWIAVALVVAVAAGLLGADYHWFSDIIAGGIVGGTTGVVAARIGR